MCFCNSHCYNEKHEIIDSPTDPSLSDRGMYVRISGDVAQPAYIKIEKDNNNNPIGNIYYNEKHEIIDSAFIKKKDHVSEYTRRSSKSNCKRLVSNSNHTYSECVGYGENKFGRRDVKYTSFHTRSMVDGVVYYTNLYVFDNGDVSTAVYKQISK